MKKKKKAANNNQPDLPEFIDRIEIKHAFSDKEKGALLLELTIAQENREQLIAQAKTSAKQWKNRIEEADLRIADLCSKGRNGFEMKLTDVRVVLDKKAKKKTIYHAVDANEEGELIETRPMTDYDFERFPIDLTGRKKPAPAPTQGDLPGTEETTDPEPEHTEAGAV